MNINIVRKNAFFILIIALFFFFFSQWDLGGGGQKADLVNKIFIPVLRKVWADSWGRKEIDRPRDLTS